MNTPYAIGWDVGGAHLKAVQIDATGKVLAVSQVFCPLWRGLHELDLAIEKVLREFDADKHFVTMTGELADIFPSRHAGVMQIAQFVTQKLIRQERNTQVKFYTGEKGFVSIDAVEKHTANIASMNWLASVQYIAQNVQQAIFLDIGSTTTDIALIRQGKPFVQGFNDATRLQTDELIYTGVVRTPLMAIAQKIPFSGNMVNVAAEHFATTADIYTLTGDLPLDENMAETADGTEKGTEASARRIARMVGRDAQDAALSVWCNLADAFKHAQLNLIKQGVLRQLSFVDDCRGLYVVGAGAGNFLVHELARQLGFKYESMTYFINAENEEVKHMASVCFPAYAVARLGNQC